MRIGYARVSTSDQHLHLQHDALEAAGCERMFSDTVSGARVDRPGLTAALSACRSGDTLVVWKLDRLGRSLPHLVETVQELYTRGVGFMSLQEQMDTTTSGGKLIFHIREICEIVGISRNTYYKYTRADTLPHAPTRRKPGPTESIPLPQAGENHSGEERSG